MTQQNTIKTFNYNRNPRGAYLYTQVLAELFMAARDDSKDGSVNKVILGECYECMAAIGGYKGTCLTERVDYMLGEFGVLTNGDVEDAFKDSKYSYEWFVEQHNRAVEIARSFDREHLTIIK